MAPIAARKPRAVVVGSLNLDEVFVVPHIAAEGETLSAAEYTVQAGGKGANQSVALAKAGVEVYHCGKIGSDGRMLTRRMEADGVRVGRVVVSENEHTGRAIIQLSASTRDNAIVLFPAANHRLSMSDVKDAVLGEAGQPGDWLVLQNEVRFSEEDGGPRAFHDLIKLAKEKGMLVALSPAPYEDDVSRIYPLESVDVLLLNAHEARGLAGEGWSGAQAATPVQLLATICTKILSVRLVVMTLGAEGVVARWRSGSGEYEDTHLPAAKLLRPVVDTTGAGDTFAGYLIAGLMRTVDGDGSRPVNFQVDNALREAVVAAAMACETHGAMAGVPTFAEVSQRIIDLRDKK